jgi:3-deoxy-D-arabino-heptulosonate 7-phosphate (DAHP) synthase class II
MAVGSRTIHNPKTRRLKITYTSCRIRLYQYSEALFRVIRDSVKKNELTTHVFWVIYFQFQEEESWFNCTSFTLFIETVAVVNVALFYQGRSCCLSR